MIRIFTDGSNYKGNARLMGYGVVLLADKNYEMSGTLDIKPKGPLQRRHLCETLAVVRAVQLLQLHEYEPHEVEIISDACPFSIGLDKVSGFDTIMKDLALLSSRKCGSGISTQLAVDVATFLRQVKTSWVAGHGESMANKRADVLARGALRRLKKSEKARKGPVGGRFELWRRGILKYNVNPTDAFDEITQVDELSVLTKTI